VRVFHPSMKRIAALTGALALLALAPAAEAGRWSKPSTMRVSAQPWYPSVDVNARGDAVVAWYEDGRGVIVATARAGRGFRSPVVVSGSLPGGAPLPRIDDRGNVAVGWTYGDGTVVEDENELRGAEGCCERVAAALRPAGRSSFGPPRTLSAAGQDSTTFDVAAGPRGGGIVWTDGFDLGDTLFAAFGARDGSIGKPRRILESGREYFEEVSLLFRRNGGASLAVMRGDGRLFERTRSPGGRYARQRVIARPGEGNDLMFRGADASDRELAIWTGFFPTVTEWSARSPGGFFGARRRIPERLVGSVALAPDGGALVVGGGGRRTSVYAATKTRRGGFSAGRRIARHASDRSLSVRAAIGNRGRGMAAWEVTADTSTVAWIFARPVRAGGAPAGGTRRLALSTRGVPNERSPATDASASGRTLVVWTEAGRLALARYSP
jgi:hypothetical protein